MALTAPLARLVLNPEKASAAVPTARITFRVGLPSPLARLTRSAIRAEGYFLGRDLLVRLEGPGDLARRLRDALAATGARMEAEEEAAGDTFLVRGEVPERALAQAVQRGGGVVVPPLRWARGLVEVDALQVRAGLPAAVAAAFPDVEVARKRPLRPGDAPAELLRAGLLLPRLTRKQAEAILAALEAGYYDVPRRVTTLDVARKLGVARSTFEEHLKKAEAQFVGALAPLARLRLLGDGALESEALRLYARFSQALGLYVNLAVRGERVAAVSLGDRPPLGAREEEHPYLARILRHLSTGDEDLSDIPLDLEVTPFEREVLEAIRRIPPGQVATYGDLARSLGKPRSARAVGNACARNPAVLVIPCHRVVPGNGGLGGYSGAGGPSTKAKLLALEGAPVPPGPTGRGKRRPRP